jgi:hypothetical protein
MPFRCTGTKEKLSVRIVVNQISPHNLHLSCYNGNILWYSFYKIRGQNMGYYGSVLILHPLALLVLVFILFVISFAIIYIMKRILKISKDEITHEDGSLASKAFSAWTYNLIALAVALIIMDIVSSSIPFLEVIHGEWRGQSDDYLPELIYIISLALLHAGLLLFSYFAFRKKIVNKIKRNKMYVVFVVSSALIWAILMCFALGVFVRLEVTMRFTAIIKG